jgi:hypothetical protein
MKMSKDPLAVTVPGDAAPAGDDGLAPPAAEVAEAASAAATAPRYADTHPSVREALHALLEAVEHLGRGMAMSEVDGVISAAAAAVTRV